MKFICRGSSATRPNYGLLRPNMHCEAAFCALWSVLLHFMKAPCCTLDGMGVKHGAEKVLVETGEKLGFARKRRRRARRREEVRQIDCV